MKTILLYLLLCTFSFCYSQDRKYSKNWQLIDSLEVKGLIREALLEVESIERKSSRREDHDTYLKSKIYRWKFLQVNTENSNNLILKEVNQTIKGLPFPYDAILNTYKANWLHSYYQDNRWKISRRGQIDDPDLNDIETWDLMTLLSEVSKAYSLALENDSKLIQLPVEKFTVLLETVNLNRKYRPSLYDILAHEELNFYKSSFYNVVRPEETFELDNYKLFSTGEQFTSLQFQTEDSMYSKVNVLKRFQHLEKLHKLDDQPEALVFTTLQRLAYVYQYYINNDGWKLYQKALINLEEQFKGQEIQGLIRLKIAEKYSDLSNTKLEEFSSQSQYTKEEFERLKQISNGKWLLKHPEYKTKAIERAQLIINEFPKSAYAMKAAILLKKLTAPQLKVNTQETWIPGENGRLYLTYRNIDSVQLTLHKVDYNALKETSDTFFKDSTLTQLVKDSAFYKETKFLPHAEDHNEHSIEIILPKLSKGTYLINATPNNIDSKIGTFQFINVTNLTATLTDFDRYELLQVLDKKTGQPVTNATIKSKTYSTKNNVSKESIDQIKHTNSKGEAILIKRPNDRRSNNIVIKTDKDSTAISFYSSYYRKLNEEEIDTDSIARTVIYTDRAIYRPGQQVFFKGMLLLKVNGKTKTVPNEFVTVYVENTNYDEIEELILKTNEYGSFSSSFTLPKNGLTGEFTIYADEDYENDSPFYEYLYDFDWTETTFSVEEYKRPTFEVKFNEVKEVYKPRDSILVSGNATSFMGAQLTNTPVIYRITQTQQYNYWRYGSYPQSVQIANDTAYTDAEGNFAIKFKSNRLQDENANYNYQLNAEVTDISGETRTASTNVKVGLNNLIANLSLPKQTHLKDSLSVFIESKNLNNQSVTATGDLKIYKLVAPNRVLGSRLWEAPEIQNISFEDFKNAFPTEPYVDEQNPEKWPQGELYYSTSFETEGVYNKKILADASWPAGKYVAVLSLKTDSGAFTKTDKKFDIVDPQAIRLPDGQAFEAIQLDTDFENDKTLKILLKTGFDSLSLSIKAYDGQANFYDEVITFSKSRELEIPYKNTQNIGTFIQIYGIKNGIPVEWETTVKPATSEIPKLNFSTNTFRNKIQPGSEETWSFKVKDSNGQTPDAEILASMYDASLDQFTMASWDSSIDFDDYYGRSTYFPSFKSPDLKSIAYFQKPIVARSYYNNLVLENFDTLDKFGFVFGEPNSYQYQRYIKKLSSTNKEKKLEGNIQGIVTDDDGLPLPGVTLVVKGTTNGTATDFDGQFALYADPGATLEFGYVGFISKQVLAEKNQNLYVMLEEDQAALDEVVVVGYGTQKTKNITSAFTVVKSEEIDDLLQGRVAGIQVESTAGASTQIQIRGAASLNNGKEPLYIVDGAPVTSFDLSSNDLASLEMLKGAAATALYGSRAANGVVIINTKKATEALTQVQARKNLDETAFFFPHITTDESGDFSFSFTTPEALTRWKLRLLAHDKNWITGQTEQIAVTQKELSIIPNAPRFLRQGDTIHFSAKVTNLSLSTLSGSATLLLFDAITQAPIDLKLKNISAIQTFNLESKNSSAVSWTLVIPEDIEAITYRVVAKAGSFSDGEENILPVLSNRILVTESIPLFVRPGTSEEFEFKNLKSSSSETLTNHLFTLEYTSNPAWYAVQSLPYLMEFEHECSEQIFSRLYANALGSHIVTSNPKIAEVFKAWKNDSLFQSNLEKNQELKTLLLAETPWVRDAASEEDQKNRIARLFEFQKLTKELQENIDKLKNNQLSSGAFPWFSGGPSSSFITRHIAAGFGHLKRLGVDIPNKSIEQKSIAYLDNQLIKDKNAYGLSQEKQEAFYKQRSHLHYLYARSFYTKEFPIEMNLKTLIDQILEYQEDNWRILSIYEKGLLALVSNRMNRKDLAIEILNSLKESAVYSETNGMYWKSSSSGWYWYQAPIETHALLIEAFSEITQDQNTIEELKIWLLQNKRTNSWSTTKATTEAAYALLLQGGNWLSLTDNTKITIDGKSIKTNKLEEVEKEAGTGYLKLKWNTAEIDSSLASIKVKNKNTSAGYGGAYWQYFENIDKIKNHSETPLNVEQQLYLNANEKQGTSLKAVDKNTVLKVGDLVTVRLVIRATSDMEFIHLKDMRASGFEPINVLSEYKHQDNTSYYESTRDAATHFFFDTLSKGTYVIEYKLRANNSGVFSNGITTIESMYAPKFSSNTKGARIKIKK